ncbi:ZIP family metal transporter [Hirschia litorea]|uniref:ZIP family metal transporter n=1 Tax=Hirschia litorea TaxID=1199156 RepID=A0ABW2IHG4_9PROT
MTAFIHLLEDAIGIPIAFGFALLAMFFSCLGIGLAASNRKLAEKFGDYAAFAGGILLSIIAITHLLPEALSANIVSIILVLIGCSVGAILDKVGHANVGKVNAHLITPIVAIGLHSFLDGMVYVASLDHDHGGGTLTAIGLILHEIPEGLITLVLCFAVFSRSALAIIVAVLAAGISTPLGAVIGLTLDHKLGETFLTYAFPVAAGLVSWAGFNLIRSRLFILKR